MKYHFRFELIQQEPFEAKALQCIMDNDPVGLLKKCRKRQGDLKKGTRRLNWQLWTACYAGAFGIRRQPDLFAALLKDEYFAQRTYKADLDDVLRLALLIGTDSDASGTSYKNACAIALRLQPLFDAEVEPMEVLARIEAAGGLNGLRVADVMTGEDAPDAEDDDSDDDEEEDELGDNEDDDSDEGDGDDKDGEDEDDGDDEPAASSRSGSSGRRASAKAGRGRQGAKPREEQQKQAASEDITREVEDGMVILKILVTQEMANRVHSAACSMLVVELANSGEDSLHVVGIDVQTSG